MNFNPDHCRNESEVESKLVVQYLLPALGYSPETWHQEVAFGNIRLDFLAFATQVLPFVVDANSPLCLVIEAKSPQHKLDKYVSRLKHYLTRLGTRYGLLTNSKELRIYRKEHNDVRLIFQCSGQEISDRITEIRALVGREVLKESIDPPQFEVNQSEVNQFEVNQFEVNQSEVNQGAANAAETNATETNATEVPSIAGTNSSGSVQGDSQGKEKPVKVIAVYHNKGGVGKTTVSINLAAALRRRGYKVLLIDIDSQANATFATGLIKFEFEEDDYLRERNISHVIESSDAFFVPDVVQESNNFNIPELDVIPAHVNLIDKQEILNRIGASTTRLVKKLRQVEGEYDFVVIDTPPSRDLYARIAMVAANYLIIPSDLKPFANQGLASVKSFLKDINEFRDELGKPPIEILGVLPSKISTNTRSFENVFPRQKRAITDKYGFPVMDSIIFERVALSHSVNQMIKVGDLEEPDPKSIFDFAQKNPSAQQSADEFDALAIEVLTKTGVTA